jgi:hypothetical protein
MSDEIILINSLDQSLPIDDNWILDKVDEIVEESLQRGDVYYALNACRNVRQMAQLSGIALAKFFYLIKENWEEYGIGDNFNDTVADYVGVHPETVSKYMKIWKMHEGKLIPEKFSEAIRQRNIKDQVPIATAVAQGYEMDEDDWQELSEASNFNEVSAKIREIKGKDPSRSSILIFISEDGQLYAQQEGETEFVGFLDLEGEGLIKEKAIQRLIKGAGVMQR